MKIAYVYDAVYPWVKGGAEKRVYEVSKRLAARGHEIHWYGIGWWLNHIKSESVELEGIKLHSVCEPTQLYVDGRRSIKEAIHFAFSLIPKLLKEQFDIIDSQEFPYFPCFAAKMHSLIRKTAFIITWYEVWGDYWFEYLGRKGVFGLCTERFTAKLPHVIVSISDVIKEELKSLGVNEKNIKVVPNGVDFYRIEKVKRNDEAFDVIYVGRLISHKNVDVLLKAMSKVKEEIPDIKCVIIGDGPEKENLISLSKRLGLDDNVVFRGFIERDEDVYSYMKASKIFVLPSIREGFPNTILEANACGLPVIIINHRKNAGVGVVKDGYNGFILNLSFREMADKIMYLLQNSDEINRLGGNAKDFAMNYDWSNIVKMIEGIYGESKNEFKRQ